ncbi:LysR family transcriptional regulator [Cytobacillus purgationiresistens]|uniref:DNA-binding transcriptional LysR family regulator n=1 Tax=Cytobacillus purgationiresistens TaxID=863449 RepID=A0ABU0AHR4_9BACI|nr:LysR family transcriptional regulator [Cytobacillus purgationiresistens]MDQ0270424.1 DNA-binding transcriptional LysR family regulator [Cytobacillus purgationiresistens]
MDIRQLRYFIAIVEERKISAAAARLHISQPPLSQQLKAMEEELGSRLVERSGRYFEVTEAGKALYKYALQITHLMEEALSDVKAVGTGVNGTLAIGVNTFSVAELSNTLHRYKAQYPNVTYKIQQNESSQICELVRERKIELGIIQMPLDLEDFTVCHLHTEPFYFITSMKHKGFDQKTVSLSDIHNDSLILPSTEGLGVHYLILEAFSRFKLIPKITGECSDISLLMELISTDFGTSIVPEAILKKHPKYPIQAYKIEGGEQLFTSVGLIWLKNHSLSRAADNFVRMIK